MPTAMRMKEVDVGDTFVGWTLYVRVPDAEPYRDLWSEEDVRRAVEDEVRNTVNELGSDILEDPSPETVELTVANMVDNAMGDLWPVPEDGSVHVLPGSIVNYVTGERRPGVMLECFEFVEGI